MKIKKISYKIINGRWKSAKIRAEEKGQNTYPTLMTVIEDMAGNIVEVPLSMIQMNQIFEKQLFLERYVDKEYPRSPQFQKTVDGMTFTLISTKEKDYPKIKDWILKAKEEGGFKENESKD